MLPHSVKSGVLRVRYRCPGTFFGSGRKIASGHNRKSADAEVNETDISAIEDSTETAARLLESQLEQERTCHSGQPSPSGTQAVNSGIKQLLRMAALSPPRLRLHRGMRLRTKRDFDVVRKQGERLAKGCLIANWKILPPDAPLRVGVITSRKIGHAAVRSRARRLLREAVRLHQHELTYPVEIVLVARASIVGKDLGGVERDFLSVLRQAKLVKPSRE